VQSSKLPPLNTLPQLLTENVGAFVASGEIELLALRDGLPEIDAIGDSDNEQEGISVSNSVGGSDSISESLGVLNAAGGSDESSNQQTVHSYKISPDSTASSCILDTPADSLFAMQTRPTTVALSADDDD
jgi:hypothetical protein